MLKYGIVSRSVRYNVGKEETSNVDYNNLSIIFFFHNMLLNIYCNIFFVKVLKQITMYKCEICLRSYNCLLLFLRQAINPFPNDKF